MDDFVLDNTFPVEALGKKVTYVIDHHLRPIRLRIAHAVLDSGELTLSPDEPNEERELIKWLPLAKCVARRMLKNDFPGEFLGYLREDGTIDPPSASVTISSRIRFGSSSLEPGVPTRKAG